MKDNNKDIATPLSVESAKPIVTLDYALYQHYLDDADMSEDQKREFLETLWTIIVGFVDLGFGVHPLHAKQDTALIRQNVDSQNPQSLVSTYNCPALASKAIATKDELSGSDVTNNTLSEERL